jgi:hypothetical protein
MGFPKSTQELLEKYWAAETTTEEETQLRAALQNQEDNAYAAYFQFLKEEAAKEITTPVRAVKETRRVVLRRALSIAAAVLVLVVAGFLVQRSMISDVHSTAADSYDDPMEAYAEAKEALLLVSEKLNSSRAKADAQLEKAQPYIEIIK